MKKNGFSKFQNSLVSQTKALVDDGASLDSASVIIGINNEVNPQYVKDTYNSYAKMGIVAQ